MSTEYNNVNDTISTTADPEVSPVTLSADWSRVVRLLLVASLAVIGSLGNAYMISAIMIEDHLKKRGNVFIVNVGLADILITGIVMPASAVVILAGFKAPTQVCQVQWFLTILSWLVSLISLTAIAGENYARLCLSPETYSKLTATKITSITLGMWVVGLLGATLQYAYDFGPAYCSRITSRVKIYEAVVIGLIFLVPSLLTLSFYIRTIMQVRLAKTHPSFKPPVAFEWDYDLMKTNMYSFFIFLIFWIPFGTILFISTVKTISSRLFYNLAWVALSKSCVNNFVYCVLDRHFRNAYINIFHYCCCKTSVTFSRRSRGEGARPTGDVRVHIIPGYNMYYYTSQSSPHRNRENRSTSSANTKRNTRPVRTQSRDVYEL